MEENSILSSQSASSQDGQENGDIHILFYVGNKIANRLAVLFATVYYIRKYIVLYSFMLANLNEANNSKKTFTFKVDFFVESFEKIDEKLTMLNILEN